MKEISLTLEERKRRHFSESFKRKKVQEVESGQSKIADICRQYDIVRGTVYKWLNNYGNMKSKHERLIVETDSDTKQILTLKARVAELERVVGQKQIVIDFTEKMIDLAEEEYGVDIKKKYDPKPSSTSTRTEKNTRIR